MIECRFGAVSSGRDAEGSPSVSEDMREGSKLFLRLFENEEGREKGRVCGLGLILNDKLLGNE